MAKIITNMRIIQKLKYARAAWRRRDRLLYPSPAEREFMRIMGAKLITADIFRSPRTGFPLTIVLSMGTVLKDEKVEREVRCGAMWIDFGVVTPYYKKGIEVDGASFHGDKVKEQERDDYCRTYGWQLMHIPAADLWHYPNLVHDRVLRFLSS